MKRKAGTKMEQSKEEEQRREGTKEGTTRKEQQGRKEGRHLYLLECSVFALVFFAT
jgi:hypothetical protein